MGRDSQRRIRRRAAGFTLVEMMVVILIIGILATIIIVNIAGKTDEAKAKATLAILKQVDPQIELFRAKFNRYPMALEELLHMPSDVDPNEWPEGGFLNEYPLDGWGNEFIFNVPGSDGSSFDLVSLGADGREGGEGVNQDIWSRRRR